MKPNWTEKKAMKRFGRVVMFLPFYLVLRPLIKRNYRLRYESAVSGDGKHPDVWYWADKLAIRFGYYVNIDKP